MIKAVVQRVQSAQVSVEGKVVAQIGAGILTFLGIGQGASPESVKKLISKITKLRIFEDEQGKINRSVLDVAGEHLIVSQFTLLADTSKGNRPSFILALHPEQAKVLVDLAVNESKILGVPTQTGIFGADMKVSLLNDGPLTLVLEQA